MVRVSATSAVCSKTKQPFHLILLALIRLLHAMLPLFHPGNVPASRIFMVSGAICRKQIAVPLRTTSFLFQLQIRKESQGEGNKIAGIPHSPFSITATFVPFSKHLFPSSLCHIDWGCWTALQCVCLYVTRCAPSSSLQLLLQIRLVRANL